MLRRLYLLLALAGGSAALIWGLVFLYGIFRQERAEALDEIAARQHALEQYAHQELRQRLHQRLAAAKSVIEAATRDPLTPASSLLLIDGDEQRLPRQAKARPGADTPARQLFQALMGPPAGLDTYHEEESEAPWNRRLELLLELRRALSSRARVDIERAVRAILAHRARYLLSAGQDLPFTLAMLTHLERSASPDSRLMRSLLRTGLGAPQRLEGLQRALLRGRQHFTKADADFLGQRIVALCEPHGILYVDFQERLAEASAPRIVLPDGLAGPSLILPSGHYVEPAGQGRFVGLKVRIDPALEEVTLAMQARHILEEADRVQAAPIAASIALSDLGVAIISPSWQPKIAAIEARYRLKVGLEAALALLVFGVMGLAALVQRRQNRFLELKNEFVAAVSHELRTPLASIRLMAETLERRTADVPGARDYPSRIIRDVDGLSFLVENILSFNRLGRGRWQPHLEPVALSSVIERLEEERDSWARGAAAITIEGDSTIGLSADRELLQLLFTNLARNACQYNEQAQAELKIAARKEAGCVVIRFGDNGIGISERERAQVFDEFFRIRTGSRTVERGSGLGLSLCRRIMQAHGGRIEVAESGPEGTVFELVFPHQGAASSFRPESR